MKPFQFVAAFFSLATALSLPAHAAVTTYTTVESYNAASSGNTTVDFSTHQFAHNYGDGVGDTPVGSSGKFGSVTFGEAYGRLYILSAGYYQDKMGGSYINNNAGSTTVTLTFDAPVTAFALNFGSIYSWAGGGASFLIETFSFAGESQSFTLPGLMYNNGVPPSFLGFTSDIAFSSVSINDPSTGLAIRDVTFGNARSSEVPEPTSFALLGLGLIGVAATYRRNRQH